MKTFATYNLGCRVNAAETNLFAQSLVNQGYLPDQSNPDIIFINTCSVTKKANTESLGLIRRLQKKFPKSQIIISGCANLKNFTSNKNLSILSNQEKESQLRDLYCAYTHRIKDKFSHTNRYLLKVQSGCTAFCSYCTVPNTRHYLWSLPIKNAVNTVKKAVNDNYQEVIITGVNLNQYTPGFSNLVEALLIQTKIPLISFGSIPLNCVDDKFISLISNFPSRISPFLHIPLQSGSDKILKLMNRNYTKEIILEKFELLNKLNIINKSKVINSKNNISPLHNKGGVGGGLSYGTDIIVGFPGETDKDFQDTYKICQQIGFKKIHVFKYSPRLNTFARQLFLDSEKISKIEIKNRSQKLRSLISQTTLPSHQREDKKS